MLQIILLFYFEILILFSLSLNLTFLHEKNKLFLIVTLGADQVKECAETWGRRLISIQVVLEVAGVLPGSQLVHHTLDLSSCQERQTHRTSAGLTANRVCSCFAAGVFPWEQQSSVNGKACEHTVVSNPLNVGAACLNQALEILRSTERHLHRNAPRGWNSEHSKSAEKVEHDSHWSNWAVSQHVYQR